jgi:indolepyruvate ferredoxin oxidoreductase
MGDAIFANLILLGMAWQSGRIALERNTIERAIELNGTAVAKNLEAFRIGCHLASNAQLAVPLLAGEESEAVPKSLADVIEDTGIRNTRSGIASCWNRLNSRCPRRWQ